VEKGDFVRLPFRCRNYLGHGVTQTGHHGAAAHRIEKSRAGSVVQPHARTSNDQRVFAIEFAGEHIRGRGDDSGRSCHGLSPAAMTE